MPRLEALLNQTGDDLAVNQRRLLQNATSTNHNSSLQNNKATETYVINEPVGTEIEISIEGKGNPQFEINSLTGFDSIYSEDTKDETSQATFTIENEGP